MAWLLRLSLFALIATSGISCSTNQSGLPLVQIEFQSPFGGKSPRFTVEVAANESDRRKGLMFRTKMKESHGMIFLFPDERINSFWMKNTILSLDMLFVSSDFRVVGIVHSVPPQNEVSRKVDTPSQYVIEFGAGVAKKFGIVEGSRVLVHGTLARVDH